MQRRHLTFNNLSEALADIRILKEKGYIKVGNWELSEVCDHLAKSTHTVMHGGSDFKVPFFLRIAKPILRFVVLPKILKGLPLTKKVNAPKSLQPTTTVDYHTVIAHLEKVTTEALAPSATFIDAHPIFGKLNREQWVKFLTWHAAHHLSFLIPNE